MSGIMNEPTAGAMAAIVICAIGILAAVWSLRGDDER